MTKMQNRHGFQNYSENIIFIYSSLLSKDHLPINREQLKNCSSSRDGIFHIHIYFCYSTKIYAKYVAQMCSFSNSKILDLEFRQMDQTLHLTFRVFNDLCVQKPCLTRWSQSMWPDCVLNMGLDGVGEGLFKSGKIAKKPFSNTAKKFVYVRLFLFASDRSVLRVDKNRTYIHTSIPHDGPLMNYDDTYTIHTEFRGFMTTPPLTSR